MSLEKLKNKKIVFFGDSITDSNRRLNPKYPMGFGFVSMVDTDYSINHSYANITLINQGVSGDKTEELLARINQDVIELNPDVVILLIGINDIWHRYDQGLEINVKEIVDRINEIIIKIKNCGSEVIVMTPFLFPTNEHFEGLLPHLQELYNEIKKMVEQNLYASIDLYQVLSEYAKVRGNHTVTLDSVHPTTFGHGIIAQEIINYLWINN